MIEMITTFFAQQAVQYATGAAGVAAAAWVLKRIPNEKIKAAVGKLFFGLGVAITLGLTKWKFSKPFWNRVIEPWFIDLIDNIAGEAVRQFIAGLRSDNTK